MINHPLLFLLHNPDACNNMAITRDYHYTTLPTIYQKLLWKHFENSLTNGKNHAINSA